jgi:hypothetical protein
MNVVIQKIGLYQRKYYLSARKYAWKIGIPNYILFEFSFAKELL